MTSRRLIGRRGLGLAAGCVTAAVVVAGCGAGGGSQAGSDAGSFFSGVPATSSPAAGSSSSGSGAPSPGGQASSPAGRKASPSPSAAASGPARLAAALGVSPGELKTLSAEYLNVANPADRRLDTDNDGYTDAQSDDLAAAQRFLQSEILTEKAFDAELLRIKFPALVEAQVRALVTANNRRIALTQRQAAAATLAGLQAFDSQHAIADAAVEKPVRLIRQYLGLPPPATS